MFFNFYIQVDTGLITEKELYEKLQRRILHEYHIAQTKTSELLDWYKNLIVFRYYLKSIKKTNILKYNF